MENLKVPLIGADEDMCQWFNALPLATRRATIQFIWLDPRVQQITIDHLKKKFARHEHFAAKRRDAQDSVDQTQPEPRQPTRPKAPKSTQRPREGVKWTASR